MGPLRSVVERHARTNVDSISRQMFVVVGENLGAEPFEDLASTNCLL